MVIYLDISLPGRVHLLPELLMNLGKSRNQRVPLHGWTYCEVLVEEEPFGLKKTTHAIKWWLNTKIHYGIGEGSGRAVSNYTDFEL